MAESGQATAVPVLVGVDGSSASLEAVDLAAREAQLRHRSLRVVHACAWPMFSSSTDLAPENLPEAGVHHDAERIVAEAVARASASFPDVVVAGEVLIGAATPVLLRCARSAALTVIGDRGLGGFSGLLVGSVAVQLAAHANGPVVVARGAVRTDGMVVVGVDGSPANDPAVGFAFEEADRRGAPLLALHAWKTPVSTGPGDMLPLAYDPDDVRADESRVLAEALAGWQEQFPGVVVQRGLPLGGSRKALIEASDSAQLVVVGSRGRGGFTGLLLGSVSHAVLHHAACPVALVPSVRIHPVSR